MRSDAFAAMGHLDGARGVARPHLLTNERERHRVVVLVDLHVVVEARAALLPLSELILLGRKRLELGTLDFFKQRTPAAAEVARHAVVDPIDALADGGVELREREERTITEFGDDPPGCDLDSNLYLRFVPSLSWSRRKNCGAVVPRHLRIR